MPQPSSERPTKPPVVLPASGGNNIILNPLQRGNPILECIRNVGKEYGDIVADYQVGRTTGVLFLSLKYHRLHPEYIHTRIEKLGHSYSLRILLILCDVSEHRDPIRELTKVCLINDITIIVAFSPEEAGHYLSTFKQFEFKPPTLIKERVDKDYGSMLRTSLTGISKINRTDVETLRTAFGSIASIAKANPEQLSNLPGFGQVKVKNMKTAFEKPFRNNATNTLAAMISSQSKTQAEEVGVDTPHNDIDKGKGKAKESGKDLHQSGTTAREASPVWDIELDNTDLASHRKSPPPRAPSEPWDIEIDLN
ncbi:dna excision repair protein ercc-1 [Moniliophthora roreri MCA 2997]|uniref:Dna excision repair protein ercc-1 n=2 Tax=Moniliophthora roreri TaxID=221103 RepID=V2XW45_MONRO|nr:dna excision repair protein ercc-1 [Moniliophthora roreri MCA 2997]KAI3618886.1 dna excision repair protein ercc-1 [Moniliophthora roreri]